MALSKGALIGIGIVAVLLVVLIIGAIFFIVPYNRMTRLGRGNGQSLGRGQQSASKAK